jgi:hypothetical protein
VEKYVRAEQATDENIIRHMNITCWMNKATGTHSEYVVLTALPREKYLHTGVSVSLYFNIICLVKDNL